MTASMIAAVQIRILAIDDHPLLREGLAAIINTQSDFALVAQASTAEEGIRQYRKSHPDVTLMDLRLPDMSGIEALIAIRSEFVNARIMMLSTFEGDVEIQRALEAGARGFLLKSMLPQELIAAIREVHAGKKCVPPPVAVDLAQYIAEEPLTPREMHILQLVASGSRNKDVADVLSIAEDTVKVHMRHVMEKLDAHDRTEAVVIGIRRGIIHI